MMKRLFDVSFAMAVLICFSPIILVLSLSVYLDLGWPIFFRQKRTGFHGKPFSIVKFRSMKAATTDAFQLKDDLKRQTKFGAFLRRTSLDELPSFFNVFLGHMSVVGPRPLPIEYLRLYDEKQMKRHDVRPGVTGLAQVSGRNQIEWEKKFDLDVWYVENRNFIMDLKIILKTASVVINKKNINYDDSKSMPVFIGSNKKGQNE